MLCVRFFTPISQCPQQFVRENVLHVDDDGDEEATAAKRDLQECPVHQVVDRALNDDLTDAERDSVFEAPTEEDDKVGLFLAVLYPVYQYVFSVFSVLGLARLGAAVQSALSCLSEAAGAVEHTMCDTTRGGTEGYGRACAPRARSVSTGRSCGRR